MTTKINEEIFENYLNAFPEDFFPWGSAEEWFWVEHGLSAEDCRAYQLEKEVRAAAHLAELESHKALKVGELIELLQKYPPDKDVCMVWAGGYLCGIEGARLVKVGPPLYNHYDRGGHNKTHEVVELTGR